MTEEAVTTNRSDEGVARPASLAEFNGQSAAKSNLQVFIDAARTLRQPLDHVLFYGPPGVGKTTLSGIIANELGVNFRTIPAPAIQKPADIITILAGVEERDVIFIDEIHGLPLKVEEVLYSALEDFRLDVIVGEGPQAKAISIDLEPFTLIGATTMPGKLSTPLKDRFGIPFRLELYTDEEMVAVLARAAGKLDLDVMPDALYDIACRSRGTPRIGLRLLRRIRDFAITSGRRTVSLSEADEALLRLGVDREGLDEADRRYLDALKNRFRGGPVGLSTLASALHESQDTLEYSLEPFLIRKGLIEKTPRGRVLSDPLMVAARKKKHTQGSLDL